MSRVNKVTMAIGVIWALIGVVALGGVIQNLVDKQIMSWHLLLLAIVAGTTSVSGFVESRLLRIVALILWGVLAVIVVAFKPNAFTWTNVAFIVAVCFLNILVFAVVPEEK